MNGLLLKDLFVGIKQSRYFLIIIVLLAVLNPEISSFIGAMGIIPLFFLLSSFGYDDMTEINSFFAITPVSRTKIVISKYILMLILVLKFLLISIIIGAFGQIGIMDIIEIYSISACGGVVACSILMPIIYATGLEKSRLIMIALFLIPSVMTMGFGGDDASSITNFLTNIINSLPIITIITLAISLFSSVIVMKRKEL